MIGNETFKKMYDDIKDKYLQVLEETENKINNLLILANQELGNYFLCKGYIFDKQNNIYYNPLTKIGMNIEPPNCSTNYPDFPNSIGISIYYKYSNGYLLSNKGCVFLYKKESPENFYNRFKKYNGKAEISKMKKYLRTYYPKEMLIADRAEKLKIIEKIN